MDRPQKVELMLPQGWEDVTLKQFEAIGKLNDIEYEKQIDKFFDLLKILLNTEDPKIISSLVSNHLADITQCLEFLTTEIPVKKDLKTLTINGQEYGYNEDNSKLSFGEMLSFELLTHKNKLTYQQTIGLALAIKLRKINKRTGKLEPFEADGLNEFWKTILDEVNVIDGHSMTIFFLQFRTITNENYKGLFGSVSDELGDSLDTTPKFDKRWAWFGLLERLSGGDITKFEEIYKQNYIACLNLLSYWKEQQDHINRLKSREQMRTQSRRR